MGFRVLHEPGTDYLFVLPSETGGDLSVDAASELLHVHRIGLYDQLQEIEDECLHQHVNGWIENGEGEQLDVIGRIIGRSRRAMQSDDAYRALLSAQILINRSYGKAQTIIDVLVRIVENALDVELNECHPCTIVLGFDGDLIMTGDETHVTVKSAVAAGIRLHLVMDAGIPAFAMGPDADDGRDGFGDTTDPSVGGMFSGLIGE